MDSEQAQLIAGVLGGRAWDSGGGVYLVYIEKPGGRLVVISDDVVCEYESEDAFDRSRPIHSIALT